ncbi:hypothetical protein LCGC14_1284080 [marine sediment metagenome]|uniref:Uncharacterized protein n=1 Tax=marine sediment metagenome TaxID=412755 RepID=A0A0F9KW42_9ZZZZ
MKLEYYLIPEQRVCRRCLTYYVDQWLEEDGGTRDVDALAQQILDLFDARREESKLAHPSG